MEDNFDIACKNTEDTNKNMSHVMLEEKLWLFMSYLCW
jgi:hypothetical protein